MPSDHISEWIFSLLALALLIGGIIIGWSGT